MDRRGLRAAPPHRLGADRTGALFRIKEETALDLQEYLAGLKGKRVAVIGIGVSNTPLLRLLAGAGVDVTACDKKDRSQFDPAHLAELEAKGVKLCLGPDYLDRLEGDVIFRTPGMRPDVPALERARSAGAEITSEMEVFFRVCPCKLIAVTGSDGKTTTTTIISELLKAAGYTTYVGGNIGRPLLSDADKMRPGDMAVLELSSFQLMTMTQSPSIAVITNLAPNHLDVHRSMEEYVDAKKNIFLHQGPGDRLVLNHDNDLTCALAPEAKGQVTFFARQTHIEKGVWLENGMIRLGDGEKVRDVLAAEDILLPGVHNVENYMAAIAAVDGLVPDEVVRQFARTFGGVEHRIELVRKKDGVSYYNDSIASSPSRTIAGLRSFKEKVILIAGGYDKHIPYDVLGADLVAHVKAMVLTGATSQKIRAAAEQAPGFDPAAMPIVEVEDFEEAVKTASRMAKPGDVVILSPASASFDKFKNFMVRGDTFKKIVQSL